MTLSPTRSARRVAAIDHQGLSSNVRGCLARKEHRCAVKILQTTVAAHAGLRCMLFGDRGIIENGSGERGREKARAYRVARDAIARPRLCNGACELHYPAL